MCEMEKSSELKPCPFCGDEAKVSSVLIDGSCFVSCKNCGASTYNTKDMRVYFKDAKDAIEAWNTRALPIPDTPEMVRALDDAYEAGRKSAEKTCKPKHWNNASGVAFARGECSECEGYLLENNITGKPRPYCPHCGAKVVS